MITLKTLGDPGVEFKPWMEDFEQVLCELRPYVSDIIQWVTKGSKEDITKETFTAHFELTRTEVQIEDMWEKANHDLWTVLFHKTTGTARIKLRVDSPKPGVNGLRAIAYWYTLVGRSGISELRSRLMKPDTVQESDIITAIERYEHDYKNYQEVSGGRSLDVECRTQAIRNMIPPGSQLQLHMELHHALAGHDQLKEEITKFAMIHIRSLRKTPAAAFSTEQGDGKCCGDHPNDTSKEKFVDAYVVAITS